MPKLKDTPLHTKIAILWFWKEGRSTLAFLLQKWFQNITVLDKNKIQDKQDNISYITGKDYLESLEVFSLIIKSPGISPYHEKIIPHKNKLSSQTQIFFEYYEWKVIGITGTKWKSTVSTLTYKILEALWHRVKLVGNIGSPVLDEIDVNDSRDYIIYELSSYMLEDFTPKLYIGYINNIFPCHLDWHKEMVFLCRRLYIYERGKNTRHSRYTASRRA